MENNNQHKAPLNYKILLIEVVLGGIVGSLALCLEKSALLGELAKWPRRGIALLFCLLAFTLLHFLLKRFWAKFLPGQKQE